MPIKMFEGRKKRTAPTSRLKRTTKLLQKKAVAVKRNRMEVLQGMALGKRDITTSLGKKVVGKARPRGGKRGDL